MKITELRLRELTGTLHHEGEFWEERLTRPIDVYPEHRAEREGFWMPRRVDDGVSRVVSVFLEVDTDEGVTGLAGPIPHEVAYLIDQQFRRLVTGEDPLATERVWDKMYRDAVHGRKGTPMMAISAIDCALWDLRGKWSGLPVHRLLGGPVRETIPAYASALGYSLEPEKVRRQAQRFKDEGYTATKWFPRWGPTDGREGIARTVELAATLREALGPDVDFMLDAWMSWDVPYTVKMSERLEEFAPRWLEEPVMPDLVAQCAEIRRRSRLPIATGEHEYTRWGLKLLMDAGAAEVLQPDTYWAGGISELVKICAVASTYNLPVIPHGHSVPANIQLSAALPIPACPFVEYLVKWNELLQFFFREPVRPVNGAVTVPTGPGMGVELDPAKIEAERLLGWADQPTLTVSTPA
ncbi:MAG: putative mandelate racemase/muconate lactonizing enzyme [uncultured Thermomicrobiales bacterium]|uniref:Putative mandelate racemase/muconate lactonizing enzyme n=1 Tax=uncultured Thermomicrobiales bacterium TaxID=1645740 RepID=A0A6J4UGC4_9BACT|nr:MAG: putative mandelate racemase/muconate lactonizing enzyme [uncultured Thermomicrobiales bacterium]